MAVANTLADYDAATVTAVKSFIVQAPGDRNWQLICLNCGRRDCYSLRNLNNSLIKKKKDGSSHFLLIFDMLDVKHSSLN